MALELARDMLSEICERDLKMSATKATARLLLGRTLGFSACREDTLDALVDVGQLRVLDKGEILHRRHERVTSFGIVLAGKLEVILNHRDGHRHLTAYLHPGEPLGLISLVDGLGGMHDMRGYAARTTVLLIPHDATNRLRDEDANLGRAIELQLAFRSRLLYERLAGDPAMPVDARLARILVTLMTLHREELVDGAELPSKLSQADIGDFLGVSRQRANFAVQQLRKSKLIGLRYATLTILDAAGLAEYARL